MKITILFLFICAASLFSMDSTKYYYTIKLINDKKWEEASQQIEKLKDINDPEYFILIFNYQFLKAKEENISVQQGKPNNDKSLILTDSTGEKQAGYIEETSTYNMQEIKKCIESFKPQVSKFKNRMDMQFGLAYVFSESKMYSELKDCLINILNTSMEINNDWLWSFNKPLKEDPKEFMLDNIQAYIKGLFDVGQDSTDSLLVDVSEVMIKDYPDLIYGYNNIGSILSVQGNNEKALTYFQEANKIDPQDILVLSNMVHTCISLKKNNDAVKYLNKIIEYGDEETKNWAKEKIKQLQ